MAMYNQPDVYITDTVSGAQSITQASSSVGLLIGRTRNGKVNESHTIKPPDLFVNLTAITHFLLSAEHLHHV